MSGPGYAVIDFETTGLFPRNTDRAIELAVVHLDADGAVTGQWDTLLQCGRDLGRQDIHGITAAEIIDAPQFEDIASDLIDLLDGRVIVAHNARFDLDFLHAELERSGTSVLHPPVSLCTMQLARRYLPGSGRSLRACCEAYDIDLIGAHRASVDAFATAQLLGAYMTSSPDPREWEERLRLAGRPAFARHRHASAAVGVEWYPRERARAAGETVPHFLERMSETLPDLGAIADGEAQLDYLAMLDRALLDRALSAREAVGLVELAHRLGITRREAEKLHLEYFWALGATAWSDEVLTPEEEADLRTVAELLAIPSAQVEKVLEVPDRMPPAGAHLASPAGSFELAAGDLVTLTGDMRRPRSEWASLLATRGIVAKDAVTKKVRLVVAADPDSQSGKARKAREYGIPIVGEGALERLLGP